MSRFILSAFSDEISGDLGVQIRVLRAHGIRYTDIRGVDGRNISEYSPAEARFIRKRLDEGGVSVACIGSPLGKIRITDDFGPHLALSDRLFRTAGVLGAKYVRIFSFYTPERYPPAVWRGDVLKRLNVLCDLAEQYGLTLLHENEKDIYGDTPERCLDLLKTLDRPNFRAVFDPANFVQCGVSPFPEAYGLLRDYAAYIHVKDALASDGSNVPAGTGDGRIPQLLAALDACGYEGFLALEPHLTAFEGLAGLELRLNKKFDAQSGGDGEAKFAAAVEALERIPEYRKIKSRSGGEN